MPIFFHPQSTFIFPLQIPRLIKELWLDALIKNIEENASHSLFQYFLQYSFRGFLSHLFTQEISRYLQGCRFCNHIDHLHKVIFITSNSFFFIQEPVCWFVLFQEQRYFRVLNTAKRSCPPGLQNNLHPFGSYFFVKTLLLLNPNLLCSWNETKHTPAL